MEENRDLNDPKALLINAKDFGIGSGFFVRDDLIVTNIHVVAGATSISAKVVGTDTVYTVEGVAAFDEKNDLVILKIAGKGMPLPIGDSDLLQSEDIVQVVGYPDEKHKVTDGPIHSIRDSDKWIRMKIKTAEGNSGGPVLNRNSKVIGVAVGGSNSYSFAIPANAVKMLLAQTQEIEPLAQWQKRKQIRAYAYLVQSQMKHSAAQKKHSATLYSEAIADLDKAIQLYPDYFLFYYNRGNMHCFIGQSKVEDGDLAGAQHYQDAINDHMKAIKLCPDCALAYDNRGVAKSLLGQSKFEAGNVAEAQQHYQDAIADYTGAIKLCPDYAVAYNNRAYVKCLLGKSEAAVGNMETVWDLYQEAIIDSNTSITQATDFDGIYEFYHTRGEIKIALGAFTEAIDDLDKAIELKPDYAKACHDREFAKRALRQQEEGKIK